MRRPWRMGIVLQGQRDMQPLGVLAPVDDDAVDVGSGIDEQLDAL